MINSVQVSETLLKKFIEKPCSGRVDMWGMKFRTSHSSRGGSFEKEHCSSTGNISEPSIVYEAGAYGGR